MASLKEIQEQALKEVGGCSLSMNQQAYVEFLAKRIWQRAAEEQREACAKNLLFTEHRIITRKCPLLELTD